MDRLFGIPLSALAVGLVIVLALVLAVVVALAVRNLVFLKLGVRNVGRRRGRTALIVVGLMLGTAIVAASLSTGDTVGLTIRSTALQAMGRIDEVVVVRGAQGTENTQLGESEQPRYLDASVARLVEQATAGSGLVDGVTPAIVQPVAVQDVSARSSEPRVMVFAPDPARMRGFGTLRATGGDVVTLAELGSGQVYLNDEAAKKLGAHAGDRLLVYAGGKPVMVTVRAVVGYRGAGTDGEALLMPLEAAQRLFGVPGKAGAILVSNSGGETSGVRHSAAVKRLLASTVGPAGLETSLVKKDTLKEADAVGATFMSLFTTFGSFSIAAGILLVFLIFVMLAAERRSELGIARAIGTRRGHLVQMFLYEGVAYDLVAAAVGSLLGVAVAWLMVLLLAAVLSEAGLDVSFAVQPRSLVVAYTLGVLLTFVVVGVSAWRVSRLNIVSAVRNLPEPPVAHSRKKRWLRVLAALALGGLLFVSGRSSADALTFSLGVSCLAIGVVLLLRALGAPERLAFTLGGVALVAWWLLPFHVIETLAGTDLKMNFSIFIVAGLLIVVGASWTIVYNADLFVAASMSLIGRVRGLAPVVKMALAYPLRTRFRTGITLAMFTLVVFTLVVGAATSGTFISAFDNLGSFGGGFDVRASAAPTSPVPDMRGAVRADAALGRDVAVVASQSYVPVEARQAGAGATFESYPLRGLDDAFLRSTTFGLSAIATGYDSAADVWRAMRTTRGLAVVDALTVPRRSNFSFGALPAFHLHGLYLEDGTFGPIPIDVRDAATHSTVRLTVIGVLKDNAPFAMGGISTSQSTATAAFGARARPSVYYFVDRPGRDAKTVAARLESRFLANGLEAQALSDVLHDAVGASLTMNRLIQGFMGLGLVVGVAALGVISARSVVERRQQIGVLRAIGFRRGMVQLSFLLESSLIALTAIVVGTVLGLLVAYNVVANSARSQNYADIHLLVPWANLGIVFLLVYAVALATTFAAARRAARIYPAEALRYE